MKMTSSDEDTIYHDAISTNNDYEHMAITVHHTVQGCDTQNQIVANERGMGNKSPVLANKNRSNKGQNSIEIHSHKESNNTERKNNIKSQGQENNSSFGKGNAAGRGRASPVSAEQDHCDFIVVGQKVSQDIIQNLPVVPDESSSPTSFAEDSNLTCKSGVFTPVLGKNPTECGDTVDYTDENIYDEVTCSRRSTGATGFEIVGHRFLDEENFSTSHAGVGDQLTYEWKRREAKKKSRALKRPATGNSLCFYQSM